MIFSNYSSSGGPLSLFSKVYNSDGTMESTMLGGMSDKYIYTYTFNNLGFLSYYNVSTNNQILSPNYVPTDVLVNIKNTTSDSRNNIYMCGTYTNTFQARFPYYLAPTAIKNIDQTSPFTSDIALVKYDPNNNISWYKNIGGAADEKTNKIVVDYLGNVYVVGTFTSSTLIIPGFPFLVKPGGTTDDIFIASYSASGVARWRTFIGGAGTEVPVDTVVDSNGNIYIVGTFTSYDLLGLNRGGATDIFINSYDTNGNQRNGWPKQIKGTATGVHTPVSTLLHTDGSIYVIGDFENSSTNITGSPIASRGQKDIFIAKYDTNGGVLWSTTIGGNGIESASVCNLDSSGNLYITGSYSSTSLTIPNYAGLPILTTGGHFLIKYTAASGTPTWCKNIKNAKSTASLIISPIDFKVYLSIRCPSVTAAGVKIMVTGFINDFAGTAASTGNVSGGNNLIVSYDTHGVALNSIFIEASTTSEYRSTGLYIDPNNNLYLLSSYISSYAPRVYNSDTTYVTFSTLTGSSSRMSGVTITKYDNNLMYIWTKRIVGGGSSPLPSIIIDIYGNLCIYSDKNIFSGNFELYDNIGATTPSVTIHRLYCYIFRLTLSGISLDVKGNYTNSANNSYNVMDNIGNIYIATGYNTATFPTNTYTISTDYSIL